MIDLSLIWGGAVQARFPTYAVPRPGDQIKFCGRRFKVNSVTYDYSWPRRYNESDRDAVHVNLMPLEDV